MRVLEYGRHALLIELVDSAERRRWTPALQDAITRGALPAADLVVGSRTVLLVTTGPLSALRDALAAVQPDDSDAAPATSSSTTIEVAYDGPDLAGVADLLGISTDEVVDRHTGQVWTVDFTGFLPGFGYLVGEDRLEVPRRSSPRASVPAGAVGLAGPFTGVYPAPSPGGWQLIGTAVTPVWRPDREPPALLTAGARIRFEAVTGSPPAPAARLRAESGTDLVVTDPGPLMLVEDLGRPGRLDVGVSRSGAFDRAALRLGNRMLGNPEDAAGLEIVLAGALRAGRDLWICVTGGPGRVLVGGQDRDPGVPVFLPAGDEVRLVPGDQGLRRWLCVRGGLDVPLVLGSRSAHPAARLGLARLEAGDALAVGRVDEPDWPVPDVPAPPRLVASRLPARWGPRADWFTEEARQLFARTAWTVSSEADRTGVRLEGPALARAVDGELPSEGLVPGAVQVPADGLPLVFGPDHPATGGYPVIAVLDDVAALAQLRPGDAVGFDL